MKKKQKIVKLVVAFLVLILLVGGYILTMQLNKGEDAEEDTEEEDFVVTTVEKDDITQLVYDQDGEEIVLKKKGKKWVTPNDPACPVNTYTVDAMKNSMEEVKASRKIEADKVDEQEYGFKKPSKVITYTTKDGEEVTFTLGKLNSVVDKYYFRMTGDDAAYLIDTTMYNSFDYNLLELAEVEEYPSVGSQDVAEYKLTYQGKTMYIVDSKDAAHKKNEDTIPDPVWKSGTDRANLKKMDTDTADKMIQAVIGLTNSECVTYNRTEKEEKKYGLDKPVMTLTVNYTEMKESDKKNISDIVDKSFTVYFGDCNEDSGEYYVYADDFNGIYTMNVSNVNTLQSIFES